MAKGDYGNRNLYRQGQKGAKRASNGQMLSSNYNIGGEGQCTTLISDSHPILLLSLNVTVRV